MTHKKSRSGLLLGSFFCAFLVNLLIADYAFTQTAFYEGKTIKATIGQSPGGLGDNRIRAVIPFLKKYTPGNPHFLIDYMPGAGGQKAANYVHRTARPDGFTIGFWAAGTVPAAVLGQPGVFYDLNEVIFLGAHQSGRPSVFFTRKELGLDSLEKLRAASGIRIGAQTVGHPQYVSGRIFAYLLGLQEPKFVVGYGGPELDVALLRGEVDARAKNADSILTRNLEELQKVCSKCTSLSTFQEEKFTPAFPTYRRSRHSRGTKPTVSC